jgi:hypothetical protein
VNAPVGINVIVPPPAEIGAGAVIVTTAAVPLTKAICVVGAIVAALAIVGAAAVVANKPDVLTSVNVGLPVQLVSTPLVGVPKTGVTMTMLVLVHAEITPLATVPKTGAVKVGDVNVGVASVGLVPNTNAPVPVSPVTAETKFALDGVAKNVATPLPKPLMPDATGNPVQLVNTPDCGVPNIGVVSVELVNSSVLVICLVTPLCTIGIRSVPAPAVATGNAEMAISVILYP